MAAGRANRARKRIDRSDDTVGSALIKRRVKPSAAENTPRPRSKRLQGRQSAQKDAEEAETDDEEEEDGSTETSELQQERPKRARALRANTAASTTKPKRVVQTPQSAPAKAGINHAHGVAKRVSRRNRRPSAAAGGAK